MEFLLRAKSMSMALDLASAVTTRLTAGGLAAQTFDVLLGTGALLFGACPRLGSRTGTAEDGGASPLGSRAPVSRGVSAVSS